MVIMRTISGTGITLVFRYKYSKALRFKNAIPLTGRKQTLGQDPPHEMTRPKLWGGCP